MDTIITFALLIVAYIAFLILNIPLHELGHLFFGKITGYRFSSLKIFSHIWYKEGGRIRFKRDASNFALGQCLMEPPKDEGKFRFVLYNLGGGLFNLAAALILIVIHVAFVDGAAHTFLREILIFACTAGLVVAALNMIPLSLGIPNDGLNVYTATRGKEAKRGFHIMLLAASETMKGKRYRDFGESMFTVNESSKISNYFVASIVMLEAERLYDTGEYDRSVEQYSRLNIDKLQTYYRNTVNANLLYYYTVHNPDFGKAKELYSDKKMKSFLKLKLPFITRILSAYEYFVNNDREKGRQLLEKAKLDNENHPNIGTKIMERDYCSYLEKMYNEA